MLTGHPASSQKGNHFGSGPLRSDGSRDDLAREAGWGWLGEAGAQRRPRVSKLWLKGLSDYHSNEMAVEPARREASGPNKRATLTKHLLKRESYTTALRLTK